MAFKKQGKELKSKIEIINEQSQNKIIASETKVICPHCNKVIGTKLGQIYQILDKRLVSLKCTLCPKCNKELIK